MKYKYYLLLRRQLRLPFGSELNTKTCSTLCDMLMFIYKEGNDLLPGHYVIKNKIVHSYQARQVELSGCYKVHILLRNSDI